MCLTRFANPLPSTPRDGLVNKLAVPEQIKAICSDLPVFPPNLNKTGVFVQKKVVSGVW